MSASLSQVWSNKAAAVGHRGLASRRVQQGTATSATCSTGSRSRLVRTIASSAAAHPIDLPESYEAAASSAGPSGSGSSSFLFPRRRTTLTRPYGQPLPHTHPHLFPARDATGAPLLAADGSVLPTPDQEITPGITAEEYESRRRRLMDKLPEGSVVVAVGGRTKTMSANIFYKFRQETNFWYLTGYQEPDAALILEKNSSSRGYKMSMFVPGREPHSEVWNGPRTGVDGAMDVFGADEAFVMDPATLLAHLKSILGSCTHIYVEPSSSPTVPRVSSRTSRSPNILNYLSPPSPASNGLDIFSRKTDFESVLKLLHDPRRSHSLAREVEALRVVKSDAEVRIMRRAGAASARGMRAAMRAAKPGRTEAQVQAAFEYACAEAGSQRPAYVPVVASGERALTIHYVANDAVLQEGDLVCLDGGGELDGYASDITRAFPCGHEGVFSEAQRELYEAVLSVARKCATLACERDGYSLAELHRRSVELLREELRHLGFQLPAGNLERYLYPHYLGHWLGIDLHDSPSISRSTALRDGMVLTIEPAVYIPRDGPGAVGCPPRFRGIGIRVEDDVVVRKDHVVTLSVDAPREVVDVEAACQGFLENDDPGVLLRGSRGKTSKRSVAEGIL